MSNLQLNASIVLHHNPRKKVEKSIKSFLNTPLTGKLYLVDNSLNDDLKDLSHIDKRVEYIYVGRNLGFGSAHNIAIRKSIEADTLYHLVFNPDIYFKKGVLDSLYNYMEKNNDVGNIMPKILYPNGDIQYLCKLLPTPFDLILRRFFPFGFWKKSWEERYELRFSGYDKIMNVPNLSGCFMFLRIETLKNVGMFDENIFMYLEDVDFNRRIREYYKTIYYPSVEVIHDYAKESYVSKKLLLYHIRSAIYYFNKWGWFFDKDRNIINSNSLKELQKK